MQSVRLSPRGTNGLQFVAISTVREGGIKIDIAIEHPVLDVRVHLLADAFMRSSVVTVYTQRGFTGSYSAVNMPTDDVDVVHSGSVVECWSGERVNWSDSGTMILVPWIGVTLFLAKLRNGAPFRMHES